MAERSKAQQDTEDAARALYAADRSSQAAGVVIDEIAPGRCVASMTIVATMLNGLEVCHGGYIFLLADSALGFCCNSQGSTAVAQTCSITYLRPGLLGDRLVAIAQLRTKHGRTSLYDIQVIRRVTGSDGAARDEVIAEFRGQTRDIDGVRS